PLGAGQFLHQALRDQVLHDGGDAGVAEAGGAGQGGARLRAAGAQRPQDQPAILPPYGVAVADMSRQACLSPVPRGQASIPLRLSQYPNGPEAGTCGANLTLTRRAGLCESFFRAVKIMLGTQGGV